MSIRTMFVDTFIVDSVSAHEPREHSNEAAAHEYARIVTRRRQCRVEVLGQFGHAAHTYEAGEPLAV